MLDLRSTVNFLECLAEDYLYLTEKCPDIFPNELSYSVDGDQEEFGIKASARTAALSSIQGGFAKKAFDTRKIDQEHERNPRGNLQFYHRSQAFIDASDATRLDNFKRLLEPVNELYEKYKHEPEYHNSYVRVLKEALDNVLKMRDGKLDIFTPQMEYLEQILFLRYRLTKEDLNQLSKEELKKRIIEKDEDLLKRASSALSVKTGKPESVSVSPDNLVQALFGAVNRQPGEKSVSRTITITIKDTLED